MATSSSSTSTSTAKQPRPSKSKHNHKSTLHIPAPSTPLGSGDSHLHPTSLSHITPSDFTHLKSSIHFLPSHNQGSPLPRLIATQAAISPLDGSRPVYRHPSDSSPPCLPFSPMVRDIKEEVERITGQVGLNHVLIQLYRDGGDWIGEHADKTLDIVPGTGIVGVSLGARRVMRLRRKRAREDADGSGGDGGGGPGSRETQLIPLSHGSVFVLGPKTNAEWLHGINADKRLPFEKSEDEIAFGGQRISLTFRCIGTFLSADERLIWGQGATEKTREDAREVVSGDEERNGKMLKAFAAENRLEDFAWEEWYGTGFDVLHLETREGVEMPLLFLSGREEVDGELKRVLGEAGIEARVVGITDGSAGEDYRPEVCFRDVDQLRTLVFGFDNIKRYVQAKTKIIK